MESTLRWARQPNRNRTETEFRARTRSLLVRFVYSVTDIITYRAPDRYLRNDFGYPNAGRVVVQSCDSRDGNNGECESDLQRPRNNRLRCG